ncbi:hypothetical protein CLOSTMETH_01025, partial [[Clostridium] methylpentosum DSM 5476]
AKSLIMNHIGSGQPSLTATFCCFYYILNCAGCQYPDNFKNPLQIRLQYSTNYGILYW